MRKFLMSVVTLIVAAVLAACGPSSGPSFQVQELQKREFTDIVTEEEGSSWGYYGVNVDKCRLRMTWREGKGWSDTDGHPGEFTATTVRNDQRFADCVKQGSAVPSEALPTPPAS